MGPWWLVRIIMKCDTEWSCSHAIFWTCCLQVLFPHQSPSSLPLALPMTTVCDGPLACSLAIPTSLNFILDLPPTTGQLHTEVRGCKHCTLLSRCACTLSTHLSSILSGLGLGPCVHVLLHEPRWTAYISTSPPMLNLQNLLSWFKQISHTGKVDVAFRRFRMLFSH